jgi:hypothetical protein
MKFSQQSSGETSSVEQACARKGYKMLPVSLAKETKQDLKQKYTYQEYIWSVQAKEGTDMPDFGIGKG